MEKRHVVVIGAGVIGLQTALFLQEAGYKTTIVAKHLPGDLDVDYASPWAGAHWRTHAAAHEKELCQWDAETYEYWKEVVAKEKTGNKPVDKLAGLKLFTSHYYWEEPTDEIAQGATSLWWRDVVLDLAVIPRSELPEGVHYGVVFTSFCVNVPKYLQYLLNTFTAAGGKVIRQDLPTDKGFGAALTAAEVAAGDRVHAFINATGLGARKLLGDEKMFPTRGQTVLVRGEASGAMTRVGKGYVAYCIPRPGSGTTIVGGTKQAGDWNGTVDKETTRTILSRAKVLSPELVNERGELEVVSEQVGFRPSREGGPRVELEVVDGKTIIHSYGHSGAGYQNSVGSAGKVLRLFEEHQRRLDRSAKL